MNHTTPRQVLERPVPPLNYDWADVPATDLATMLALGHDYWLDGDSIDSWEIIEMLRYALRERGALTYCEVCENYYASIRDECPQEHESDEDDEDEEDEE
jgi:hypothetical protein